MPEALSRVRSVGPFKGWLRGAIVNFKYHGEWDRAKGLAVSLAGVAEDLAPFDAFVSVPLHPARLKQRGFNQSQLLAEEAARLHGVESLQPLDRIKRTTPQVGLDGARRRTNVAGAFSVHSNVDLAGLRVVLVDDVITTGSTLAACAEALAAGGVASVVVVTLSREM
jgi:ComF family protein